MIARSADLEYEAAFERAVAGAKKLHRSLPRLSAESALRRARHLLSSDGVAAAMHEPSLDLVAALISAATRLSQENAQEALRASLLAVRLAEELSVPIPLRGAALVRALSSLLSTARSAGAFDKALEAEERILALLEDDACSPDIEIDALLEIGRLYYRRGAFREVLFFADEALELSEEIRSTERIANSLRLAGSAHFDLGDYRKALDYLWRARRTTQDLRTVFACLQTLSLTYSALGHFRAALEVIDQAHRLVIPDPRPQDTLRLLWARAWVHASAGDGPNALQAFESVAEGFLRLQRPQAFAESLLEVSLLLLDRSQTIVAAQQAAHLAASCFDDLGLGPQARAARVIADSARTHAALRRGFEALRSSLQRTGGAQSPARSAVEA